MPVFRNILFVVCLSAGPVLFGQGASFTDEMKFFARQAEQDARFEQQQRFELEQDEWDFWQDQRAYEEQLSRKSTSAYSTYIVSKRNAYRLHQSTCSLHCGHGDYYYLQAAFYLQFGERDAASLAVSNAPGAAKEEMVIVRN